MKLLIAGNLCLSDEQKSKLSEVAEEIYYHKYENERVCFPEKYDFVVCNNLFVNNDISSFTSLKAIQLISAGIDENLKERADEQGVQIFNANGIYSIPMAEHTVMQILNIYRNEKQNIEHQKNRIWEKDRNIRELSGSKVCIVGYGNVGREIAKRLKAFGCYIEVVNRSRVECENVDRYYPITDIAAAVSDCDILIIAIAEAKETNNLINKDVLKKLKCGSVIVNVSRGSVLNEAELIYALMNNGISAALDVFSKEPLDKKSVLWELDNVYITPHSSFISDKNNERLFERIIENIKIVRGE